MLAGAAHRRARLHAAGSRSRNRVCLCCRARGRVQGGGGVERAGRGDLLPACMHGWPALLQPVGSLSGSRGRDKQRRGVGWGMCRTRPASLAAAARARGPAGREAGSESQRARVSRPRHCTPAPLSEAGSGKRSCTTNPHTLVSMDSISLLPYILQVRCDGGILLLGAARHSRLACGALRAHGVHQGALQAIRSEDLGFDILQPYCRPVGRRLAGLLPHAASREGSAGDRGGGGGGAAAAGGPCARLLGCWGAAGRCWQSLERGSRGRGRVRGACAWGKGAASAEVAGLPASECPVNDRTPGGPARAVAGLRPRAHSTRGAAGRFISLDSACCQCRPAILAPSPALNSLPCRQLPCRRTAVHATAAPLSASPPPWVS